MKLIVFTVVSIAVFSANCRERPDGRELINDVRNLSDGRNLPDDRDLSNDRDLSDDPAFTNERDLSNDRDLSDDPDFTNGRDSSDGHDFTNDPDIFDGGDLSYGVDLSNGPTNETSTIEPEPFLGGPGDLIYSADVDAGVLIVGTGSGDVQGGFENQDYSDADHQLKEDGRVQNELKPRGGSKCKSDIVCSLLGGSCVTNSTYCSGREVPSVCNGAKCKCCIPVSLEVKVHDLETELRSMVVNLTAANSNMMALIMSANSNMDNKIDSIMSTNSNLTIANSNMDLKIDSLNLNFTDEYSDIKNDLQFIKENLTNANAMLDAKLDSIKEGQGCPKGQGLFFFAQSNQCFRFLNDTKRSWDESNTACRALGLELAMPFKPISLRSYLITKFGTGAAHYTWIGGRGDGTYIRWQRTGEYISSSNPLWISGHPGSAVTTNDCLWLRTYESALKSTPDQPYRAYTCSYKSAARGLCELRRG